MEMGEIDFTVGKRNGRLRGGLRSHRPQRDIGMSLVERGLRQAPATTLTVIAVGRPTAILQVHRGIGEINRGGGAAGQCADESQSPGGLKA